MSTDMKRASTVQLFFLVLMCSLAEPAIAVDAEGLIMSRAGNLPILLIAPHGGLAGVPNVSMRRRGVTSLDSHTIELTHGLARRLQDALKAEPYVVAARFSRKYIDANRAEADAFDSQEAKPVYDAYHKQIRSFVADIKQRFPHGGLLLDVHGQAKEPGTVHRGTRNGATVAALLRLRGPAALIGPDSIFGVLQGKGYPVFPRNTPLGNPREDARFDGGYTVQTYGSGRAGGIDAIQVEIGRDLRTDSRFISALAEAIVVFYKTYLMAAGLDKGNR